MNNKDLIIKLAQSSKGIVTTSQVSQHDIARIYLKELVDEGKLIHSERGIYVLPEAWDDEFFVLQYKYSKGVFSHETALFLHGYYDQTPAIVTMTFPYGYNNQLLAKKIIMKKAIAEIYDLGQCSILSPAGHEIKVYSIEKTLCDIVRNLRRSDIQRIISAMKQYANDRGKNIPLLMEYAKMLNVSSKISRYMEILL